MYILNLSQSKLEEILPYLDTVIVPVCSISVDEKGMPNTGDSLLIRSAAQRLDDQLSGRILILPETVHTQIQANMKADAKEASAAEAGQAAESALSNFLFEIAAPYKTMGFTKLVFLYGAGTRSEIMDEVLRRLEESGLQPIAFQLAGLGDIDSFAIPGIIGLWSRKEANF